ncbi:hypothetical protein CDAR_396241 [Caerostris darwini]|uniref:Uncharacterized protein n=1 Tax=Caerostris darwini TaxID=1538125 RepID=A0AAV4US66_9ARAC|nr:hypothetical protein CDAR_396241 [Caerostris darwini]
MRTRDVSHDSSNDDFLDTGGFVLFPDPDLPTPLVRGTDYLVPRTHHDVQHHRRVVVDDCGSGSGRCGLQTRRMLCGCKEVRSSRERSEWIRVIRNLCCGI